MTESTDKTLALAGLVLQHELAGRLAAADLGAAIERILGRLVEVMAPLIGVAGFAALVKRAIHLTYRSYPCLTRIELQVGTSIVVVGLQVAVEREGTATAAACATRLLATLISLLESFIGEDLASRTVARAWPGLSDTTTRPKRAERP
jgi:hypothetical protein